MPSKLSSFLLGCLLLFLVFLTHPFLVEEVVSTLVGSLGLIASVPIATYLATWMLKRKK